VKIPFLIDPDIADRVRALQLRFDEHGVDPYGVTQYDLSWFFTTISRMYRYYFRVRAHGIEHVPSAGRAMLIGNHSGGIAIDGLMVIGSMFLEKDPPRLAQGMVEKFISGVPFAGMWAARTGQFTGLPEHAIRMLEDERLLMVFPEGARGTAKLFPERYSLVEFGTGFMRLALQTRTPIVPFGFVGGGDAVPTVHNSYELGKMLGVPYVPFTPYGVAFPLPKQLRVHYGEPMMFEGTGREDDDVIVGYVEQVKDRITQLIEEGRAAQ
jgi:1-acyl-sn-glycerol-3-phosphate acyltransferase